MTRRFAIIAVVVACLATCGSDAPAVYVSAARAAHFAADEAIERGDEAGAREVLEQFFAQPPPASMAKDDARIVRQDACFRLARLSLASDANDALQWAERGLNQGEGNDVFTANLFVVRGQAKEALGREIDAAADYHEALKINDILLERTLNAGGEP